jgi:hypothetical protein
MFRRRWQRWRWRRRGLWGRRRGLQRGRGRPRGARRRGLAPAVEQVDRGLHGLGRGTLRDTWKAPRVMRCPLRRPRRRRHRPEAVVPQLPLGRRRRLTDLHALKCDHRATVRLRVVLFVAQIVPPAFVEPLEIMRLAQQRRALRRLVLCKVGQCDLTSAIGTLATRLVKQRTVQVQLRIRRVHTLGTNFARSGCPCRSQPVRETRHLIFAAVYPVWCHSRQCFFCGLKFFNG